MAQRVINKTSPMGFGGALADSIGITLAAAAVGGLGSMALSQGDIGAGIAGALASGAGTALINGAINSDKRKMSVYDALR